MDRLASMNVFIRVAKAGSFAGGARELDISRAMVTKHISYLESHLNTRLFNRTTRSLSLTEAGASYLERCQQVLEDIEEMEAAITHLQQEPRGLLKISSPQVIGAMHIAPALSEFMHQYPELSVEIILQGNMADLIEEGVDMAIHLGALDDTSLIARPLASSILTVCGAPDYFARHGRPQTPEDLADHSCLVNWAIPPRNQWRFKSDTGQFQSIKVSGRMQSNVADTIRTAAISGLGLVMLPKYIVGKDIEKGKLQPVLEDFCLPPLEIYAIYPHRKYLSAKVRTFLEFLQQWLPQRIGIDAGC
ncbi:MAG: LysR family transcriptional regulator [Methylococcales bacterium]|nr:LysR family transcriptional regulator [Methylococcales bacterium]